MSPVASGKGTLKQGAAVFSMVEAPQWFVDDPKVSKREEIK
jgi:hypothetical protein